MSLMWKIPNLIVIRCKHQLSSHLISSSLFNCSNLTPLLGFKAERVMADEVNELQCKAGLLQSLSHNCGRQVLRSMTEMAQIAKGGLVRKGNCAWLLGLEQWKSW